MDAKQEAMAWVAHAKWYQSKERLRARAETMRVVRSARIVTTTGGRLGKVERVVLWVEFGDHREHCERWQRFTTAYYDGMFVSSPNSWSWETICQLANPEQYTHARSDGNGVSIGGNSTLCACDEEDRYRDELREHLRFTAEERGQ